MSLYLHIPFCRHRCSYCDFNTYTSLGELKERYGAALSQEIRQVGGGTRRPAHTIFFGGGTPSLMSPESLAGILGAAGDSFGLAADAEITMEMNPGTVDGEYLAAVRSLGVNRISFGMQSAVASELVLLEREHDAAAVVEAVGLARAAGFDNLNLDLIYSVPGQTLASWEESLRFVLELDTEHLSLYCLTIEPGTPMQRWLNSGRMAAPDADLAADQYEMACDLLGEYGYGHYEISNWAKTDRACEHNLTYWRNRPYLGLGAGAHGYAAGYRYQVVKQPRTYIRRIESGGGGRYPWSAAVAERHEVERPEAMTDMVITQLRLLDEGLDLAEFEGKFGRPFVEVYGETVGQLKEWGLIREGDGRLLLTRQGVFLSNQVFYRFM